MTKIDHLLQVLKIGTHEQIANELADFYTHVSKFFYNIFYLSK